MDTHSAEALRGVRDALRERVTDAVSVMREHAEEMSDATVALAIRRCVDSELAHIFGNPVDKLTPAERAVFDALERLQEKPGEPFLTTRLAIAVEADRSPTTVDVALARFEHAGLIARRSRVGKGTTIRVLREAA